MLGRIVFIVALLIEFIYVAFFMGSGSGARDNGIMLIFALEMGIFYEISKFNLQVKRNMGRIPTDLRMVTAAVGIPILLMIALSASGLASHQFWLVWEMIVLTCAVSKFLYLKKMEYYKTIRPTVSELDQ